MAQRSSFTEREANQTHDVMDEKVSGKLLEGPIINQYEGARDRRKGDKPTPQFLNLSKTQGPSLDYGEIAGYGCVGTFTCLFGDDQTEDFLQSTLDEELTQAPVAAF